MRTALANLRFLGYGNLPFYTSTASRDFWNGIFLINKLGWRNPKLDLMNRELLID